MSDIKKLHDLEQELVDKLKDVRELIQSKECSEQRGDFTDCEVALYLENVSESRIIYDAQKVLKGKVVPSKNFSRVIRSEMDCDSKPSITVKRHHIYGLREKVLTLLAKCSDENSIELLKNFNIHWKNFEELLIDDAFYRTNLFFKGINVHSYLTCLADLTDAQRKYACNYPDTCGYYGIEEIEAVKHRLVKAARLLYFVSCNFGALIEDLENAINHILDGIDTCEDYSKYAEYEAYYLTDCVLYLYKWDMRIYQWQSMLDKGKVKINRETLLSYRI